MTALTATIGALDDATAVRVLADVADYQAPLPDPAQLRAMETGLRQATATDPALTSYTDPGAPANMTTLPRMIVALWRWFYKKTTLTSGSLKTYADDSVTVNASATVSDDGTTQIKGSLS